MPTEAGVYLRLRCTSPDLKKLFTDLGIKAMTSGFMNARLDADGTIANVSKDVNPDLFFVRPTHLKISTY